MGIARALKIGGVFESSKECTENLFVHMYVCFFQPNSIEEHERKIAEISAKPIKGKYVSEKM